MKIKIKQFSQESNFRIENSSEIKEVLLNEDFLHPNQESIALGFKNKDSSGLIELSPREVDMIIDSLKKKKHLIKGIKIFKE